MQIGFFAAGGILIALGCYWLWRLLSERDTDKRAQNKRKIGCAILVLIAGGAVVLSGCSPLPILFLVGSIFIMVDIWLFRIMKKSESKTVVCALMLIAGGIMALSSFAPLAAKTEAPNTVSVLPSEAVPKESEQVKVEVPPTETPVLTAIPSATPTDESANDDATSTYLEDIEEWAGWLNRYTEDMFSSLSEADYDNEIWQGQIEWDINTIRENIDLLKTFETPEGLGEVEETLALVTDSYYLVTEDVARGVKNMDGEECAKNVEAATKNYTDLLSVIEKYRIG